MPRSARSTTSSRSRRTRVSPALATAGVVDESAGQTTIRSCGSTSRPIGCTTGACARPIAKPRARGPATQSFRTPVAVAAPAPVAEPDAWRPVQSRATRRRSSSASARSTGTCRTTRWPRSCAPSPTRSTRTASAAGRSASCRKSGGTNCGGYSCDVLCAGSGSGQRQYDVLGDIDGAQNPGWNGPNTLPGIRVDVCEVQ